MLSCAVSKQCHAPMMPPYCVDRGGPPPSLLAPTAAVNTDTMRWMRDSYFSSNLVHREENTTGKHAHRHTRKHTIKIR